MAKTMYAKIWESHLVHEGEGTTSLLYVDRHLLHEVTSPQAFAGLRLAGRKVRRPEKAFAVMDHNVSTRSRDKDAAGPLSRLQMDTLKNNCEEFGVTLLDLNHPDQGIIHVTGPELGLALPGTVIVCGDSHTATHGAFGALAFGIGTSEVEHVLATQTLQQQRAKTMRIRMEGKLSRGVTPKDVILAIIGRLGIAGATGHAIEYTGSVFREMSLEGRMTVCNMSIEAGARAGMIAPDEKTFAYLQGRDHVPPGGLWEQAVAYWKTLPSDAGAVFDAFVEMPAAEIEPQVTWGTNPGQVTGIGGKAPVPADFADPAEREAAKKALAYMKLRPGVAIKDIEIDRVFIGSCTNSRIEDLRAAAAIVQDKKIAATVKALVVPGSGRVKRQAEDEGLDEIFVAAGFEWRYPGCSMCLAMNDDVLAPGERAASTSNRNFEGRQGKGGLTHLVSPQMAAAAALAGRFVDVREYIQAVSC